MPNTVKSSAVHDSPGQQKEDVHWDRSMIILDEQVFELFEATLMQSLEDETGLKRLFDTKSPWE